ncbi:hypothetical protein BC834DRAFT_906268 [Gloeopeniophorella convolvens]|nr:hypothetical protein BC834DRAFT_906268 [Gloeopeniophorella convolvens]
MESLVRSSYLGIAMSHRRLAKQSPNCEAFHGNVVGRTLALLLECGAVYSLLWALYVAVVVKGCPLDITRINSSLTEIIVYVAATYPSAILLIAALQRSVYSDASRFGGLPRAGAIGPPTKKCLADLLEELSGDEHAAEPQPEASMESVIDISSEFHPTPTTFLETANPLRNST